MYIISDFEEQIMREIDSIARLVSLRAINLGGISGPSGGNGLPPGGFIGQLLQRLVTFDYTESTDPTIPVSGMSLINNLNRIRAGVALGDGIIEARHLASGLIIPTDATITVEGELGSPTFLDINTVRFTGLDVEELSPGLVNISISHTAPSGITSSGIKCYGWYLDGRLATFNDTTQLYKFNDTYTIQYITFSTPQPSPISTISGCIITSFDSITWDSSIPFTFPSGLNQYTYSTPDFVVYSGMLVGLRIDGDGVDGPNNLNIIMNGVEEGFGGNTLPTFTPRRVPFANNDTGLLTESARLNHRTDNNSDMLVVGADDYIHIGATSEKVGIDLVRDEVDGGFIQEVYSNGTFAPSFATFRARGSRDVPDAVILGDTFFRFTGRGYITSGWSSAPQFKLEARATEDWTNTAQGSKVVIGITKIGETVTTDSFQVDSTGLLVQENLLVNKTITGNDLRVINSAVSGYVMTAIDGDGNALWLPLPSGGGGVSDAEFVTYKEVTGLTLNAIRPELKNYNPDSIPVSPSAYDDEFNDDSIDAKWNLGGHDDVFSLYDNLGNRHISESLYHGYITFQGSWSFTGEDFFQAFTPADDNWSLVAKIHPGYNPTANTLVTFGVIGASSTSNYYQARIGNAEDGSVSGVRVFYDDGTGGTEAIQVKFNVDQGVYIMLSKRLDGLDTKYITFISGDGVSWYPTTEIVMTTMTTADLTYLYFGNYNAGGFDPVTSIDFVRYFPDAGHFNIGANV